MGRASRGKRLALYERGSDSPRAKHLRRNRTNLAWWVGALAVVGVIGALALVAFRPATTSNSDGGQAASDQTSFATTGGELSLADLKGSKVVLYFYEGAG